tara:strand:- start:939 stop:1421 length:483 start_codon:yes stop_codon:yes gene_type:complete
MEPGLNLQEGWDNTLKEKKAALNEAKEQLRWVALSAKTARSLSAARAHKAAAKKARREVESAKAALAPAEEEFWNKIKSNINNLSHEELNEYFLKEYFDENEYFLKEYFDELKAENQPQGEGKKTRRKKPKTPKSKRPKRPKTPKSKRPKRPKSMGRPRK